MAPGTVCRSCTRPQPSSFCDISHLTSSSGIRRDTGCCPPGSANAPAIYWSPSDSTGTRSGEPQIRQVVRVVKLVRGECTIRTLAARDEIASRLLQMGGGAIDVESWEVPKWARDAAFAGIS